MTISDSLYRTFISESILNSVDGILLYIAKDQTQKDAAILDWVQSKKSALQSQRANVITSHTALISQIDAYIVSLDEIINS